MWLSPGAANIRLNFTSLSDLALNIGHSVCKVSLAHNTEEWLSALWSTWRLRAQRKQLSLQSTLDCQSQQAPFPSPPPCVRLHVPSASELTAHGTEEQDKQSLVCEQTCSRSCGWGRPDPQLSGNRSLHLVKGAISGSNDLDFWSLLPKGFVNFL